MADGDSLVDEFTGKMYPSPPSVSDLGDEAVEVGAVQQEAGAVRGRGDLVESV